MLLAAAAEPDLEHRTSLQRIFAFPPATSVARAVNASIVVLALNSLDRTTMCSWMVFKSGWLTKPSLVAATPSNKPRSPAGTSPSPSNSRSSAASVRGPRAMPMWAQDHKIDADSAALQSPALILEGRRLSIARTSDLLWQPGAAVNQSNLVMSPPFISATDAKVSRSARSTSVAFSFPTLAKAHKTFARAGPLAMGALDSTALKIASAAGPRGAPGTCMARRAPARRGKLVASALVASTAPTVSGSVPWMRLLVCMAIRVSAKQSPLQVGSTPTMRSSSKSNVASASSWVVARPDKTPTSSSHAYPSIWTAKLQFRHVFTRRSLPTFPKDQTTPGRSFSTSVHLSSSCRTKASAKAPPSLLSLAIAQCALARSPHERCSAWPPTILSRLPTRRALGSSSLATPQRALVALAPLRFAVSASSFSWSSSTSGPPIRPRPPNAHNAVARSEALSVPTLPRRRDSISTTRTGPSCRLPSRAKTRRSCGSSLAGKLSSSGTTLFRSSATSRPFANLRASPAADKAEHMLRPSIAGSFDFISNCTDEASFRPARFPTLPSAHKRSAKIVPS
mmetsp:Transcript_65613/g.182497  ORF Transcript_65613/g.182497 Transcript_65613/m.182497 type:complete len:566 (+) Transcript_65613:155-1852(+)